MILEKRVTSADPQAERPKEIFDARERLIPLGLLVAATLFTAGCGGTTTVKTEAEPTTVTVTVTEEPAAPPTSTEEQTTTEEAPSSDDSGLASVGDAITLHGYEQSLAIEVTVLKVLPNDMTYDQSQYAFEAPERGEKYVSVKLRMRNVGSDAYDDSPSNGAVLVDSQDAAWDAGISLYTHKPDIGSPKIAPGDARVGWITFTVPKRTKPTKFQLALESGFSDEAGEWLLR
jgi:hypothetical protein